MRARLESLFEGLADDLRGGERLLVNYQGESSDFVRVGQCRIRQAGRVVQHYLDVELIEGGRHLSTRLPLTGTPAVDLERASRDLKRLRGELAHVPEDPYLNLPAAVSETCRESVGTVPDAGEAVSSLLSSAAGLDLAGHWASGVTDHGLADSLGSRHWHSSRSFNLDWSCYLRGDLAVKSAFAGAEWDADLLARKLAADRETLEVLKRPPVTLSPGQYRAYFTPSALGELLGMLDWGDWGARAQRTRQSALVQLVDGERVLDPRVSIQEDHPRGLVPGFTREGFPTRVPVSLIASGRCGGALVDARSGAEYGLAVNAGAEYPQALAMAAGELETPDVLRALDTGVYLSNLWYCNWSDRNHGRITGMTRFACLWVEGGVIKGPLKVMRFDDTLYRLLGGSLEAVSRDREMIMDAETYEARSSRSALLPGILVRDLRLTL